MSYLEPTPKFGHRLGWTFILSILLHVGFLTYHFASFSDLNLAKESETESPPIELSQVPPETMPPQTQVQRNEAKRKEIAETEKVDNDKIDPNAKFLGEKNQVVEKELKAKRTDDFRAKAGTGAKGWQQSEDKMTGLPPTVNSPTPVPEEELAEGEGPGVIEHKDRGVKRNWKTLSLRDLSVGGNGAPEAATDDHLSGVAEGENTLLSTREFKFYSYYNRIKDLLRQHWKPSVERKLAKLWSKGKNIGETEVTTRVVVLLDGKGVIQKISRIGSSGFDEVDSAAIEAFEKASPFPNPPKGLVESDGFVRVHWDFILKTEAAPLIQFRTMGNPGPP